MLKKSAALLCLILLVLTACGKYSPNNVSGGGKNSMELYFLDSEGKSMVTERRTLPEDTEDVIVFAVNELIKGPAAADHRRALPETTRLIDVKREGATAVVNLSSEFDTGENLSKLWSRYTLINTVCSVNGISKTQILVEGKKITSISTGEPLGEMGKEDIVTDVSQTENNTVTVTLYYADSNAMYLVPEKRQVTAKEGEKPEITIMTELFKGPLSEGLNAVISPDVKVLSAETKDGVCFINLSQEFVSKSVGGSTGEMLSVYSVVNTLCGLENVDKVQILIEGKKAEGFGHMDISQPLEPDNKITSV